MLRIPLLVPFEQKDAAKEAGATWDENERAWMWPDSQPRQIVRQWLPRIYRDDLKPPHLTPALVPQSMWGVNLRSLLTKEQWDMLRKDCYVKAAYRCQVCGTKGTPPHCNEQWVFKMNIPNSNICIQHLQRLACLCKECHMVKHLGFAQIKGTLDETIAHMAKINGWTMNYAKEIADSAFQDWEKRNKYEWVLDITYLKKHYDIELTVTREMTLALNSKYMKKVKSPEKQFLSAAYEDKIYNEFLDRMGY